MNTDDPTDFIETTTFAEGIDSQDKGSGKAMTYADKYSLMKVYKISAGDDPDQTASEDVNYTRKATPAPKCADCGGMLYPVKKRDGTMWSVNDMAEYSRRRFDRCLCADCMKKAEKNES